MFLDSIEDVAAQDAEMTSSDQISDDEIDRMIDIIGRSLRDVEPALRAL